MKLINNGKVIEIKPDGDLWIEPDSYKSTIEMESVYKTLYPILENGSIEYDKIPPALRKKITFNLNQIFNRMKTTSDETVHSLRVLREFGLSEENQKKLFKSSKRLNKALFRLGYSDIDNYYDKEKVLKDKFLNNFKNSYKRNNEYISKFVNHYKEQNLNDFKSFNESLQAFGVTEQHEILKLYNDNIDESFELDQNEFGIISLAKKELIDLQKKIIEDAVSSGLTIPSELPRFISPSDRIKNEKINPEKIKTIQSYNSLDSKLGYKGDYFNEDHSITNELKQKFIKEIKLQEKIFDIDTNDCQQLLHLQLVKNNGFSFDKTKEWAYTFNDSNSIGFQKALAVSQSGLKYCNKLVECGILKTSDCKNFTFSSPKAREILLENPKASFNRLGDILLDTYKDLDIKTESSVLKLDNSIVDKQKTDFFEFLDAEYNSFYKNRDIPFQKFLEDISIPDSAESQRLGELYPSLKKFDFKELVGEYEDLSKYVFERIPSLDFKKEKSKLNNSWEQAQKNNRAKATTSSALDFINISAIKFDGISLSKLNDWKNNVVSNGYLDEETADKYINTALKQAEKLTEIGILNKIDQNEYEFKDSFAKESLYLNFNKSLEDINKTNKGVKVLKDSIIESKNLSNKESEVLKNEQFLDSFKLNLEERIGEKLFSSFDINLKDGFISVSKNNITMSLDIDKNSLSDENFDLLKNTFSINSIDSEKFPAETKKESTNEKTENSTEKFYLKNISAAKKELVAQLNLKESSTKEDYKALDTFIEDQKNLLRSKKLTKDAFYENINDFKTAKESSNEDLIHKLTIFNSSYEKSNNEKYIEIMQKEEQSLSSELESRCFKDKNFKLELEGYCNGDEIDSNKYFYLSNLLDGLEESKNLGSLLKNKETLEVS